jgi:multicomponent Na+:H+ antiporter subunit B
MSQATDQELGTGESSGPAEPVNRERSHRPWLGLILVAAMFAALATAMVTIPREHAPLPAIARYALEVALPRWHLTEPVNEIVYGTRGVDTFGETFLLLAAVISVVVITRSRESRRGYFGESLAGEREQQETDPPDRPSRSEQQARAAESEERGDEDPPGERGEPPTPDATPLGTPAPETADGMSVVARTAIRVVLPLLAIAGCYLVAEGFSPGGGFPAGAVILGVALLAYAGYGRRRLSRVIRPSFLETIEMAGAAAIILTELLGLLLKGSFSANWLPLATPQTILSGGVAQLFSGSELLEVATGLGIAVFALLGMGHDWGGDQD